MSGSCGLAAMGAARPLYLYNSSFSRLPFHASRAFLPLSSIPFIPSLAASPIKHYLEQLCDTCAGHQASQTYASAGLDVPEGVAMAMEATDIDDFVEVGLIRSTHGIKGELKVMSLTDFPEQRFERPGTRWVGFYRMGKLVGLRKIELLSGRKIMQGKDSAWLLTFQGIDSMEKASEVVGASVLVKNADRPLLDADQFYIPELIGMSVQLKDSGKVIGRIVDIFNSGASDLLRVSLHADKNNDGKDNETKDSLIWIPFVKEIVPIVDKETRFVEITPPEGLLELNLPSKRPLKQELRKEALRSKRKLRDRMSGVRKKVVALKQDHILSGLARGDASQREALKMQLLTIDFTSFKRAMETSSSDFKLSFNSNAYTLTSAIAPSLDWKGLNGWLRASPKELKYSDEINESTWRSWCGGLRLVAEGKVAIVALVTEDLTDAADLTDSSLESNLENQAGQLLAMQELAKTISGEELFIPWVVVTTKVSSEYVQNLLKDESYFGLSEQQVHFVQLSCLPIVKCDGEGVQRILMESQWRIVTSAGGDGQVIGDLDDSGVLNSLIEMGINYIHICFMDKTSFINMDPAIFGVMEEQNACVGMKVTSEAFEGYHGVLCVRKGSIDGRGRSIFIPASEKPAGSWKSIGDNFEHFTVLKPNDVPKAASFSPKDEELIYRVPVHCNYTLSVEYLKHLSLQRHGFIYEGELKEMTFTEYDEEGNLGTEICQEYAIQLKCSLHNVLMFCSQSKVALLNCDMFGDI